MIKSHELKKREIYLEKLIGFQDTEPVKVITGIRRCGKSSLLKLMIRHLKEIGISPNQIIDMNFESYDFKDMTSDDVYHYVKKQVLPDKRMYLFFDELRESMAGKMRLTLFVLILTVISTSLVPMHIFSLPNIPPIFLEDA